MYDSKRSETQSIKCAVPQGSILGPLLFIIYMNDIGNASELLFCIMYADDTSVQISGNNIKYLVISLTVELKLLSRWLKTNKVYLNGQKTFFLVFHLKITKHNDLNRPLSCIHTWIILRLMFRVSISTHHKYNILFIILCTFVLYHPARRVTPNIIFFLFVIFHK